jgi:hypothetical protein
MTRKKNEGSGPQAASNNEELVFVVDISSFTNDGFVGTSSYEGVPVNLQFDDIGDGFFLSREMAARIRAKKGTTVSAVVEGDHKVVVRIRVAAVGNLLRVSDARVYHAVGGEGGAIIRIRKN